MFLRLCWYFLQKYENPYKDRGLLEVSDVLEGLIDLNLDRVQVYHDIHVLVEMNLYLVGKVQLNFVQVIIKLNKEIG